MQEIVRFETDTGQQLQITGEDVRKYICENATEKETMMFLQLCQAQRLNPFMREAYLVKYGSAPASMIVGKEVFLKRAAANPDYEGFEAGVTFVDANGQVQKREGGAVYAEAGENLVGGWCRVFVRNKKPVYNEASLDEYSTGKAMWKNVKDGGKPSTMIRKVALTQSLREAFPELQGMYSQEEIKQVSDAELPEQPIEAPQVEVQEVEITEEQRAEIRAKISELAQMRHKEEASVMQSLLDSKTLANAGYVSGSAFTHYEAKLAIELLDNWLAKAHEANIEAAQAAKEKIESQRAELAEDDIVF